MWYWGTGFSRGLKVRLNDHTSNFQHEWFHYSVYTVGCYILILLNFRKKEDYPRGCRLSLLSFTVQPQLRTKPYTSSLFVDQLNLPFSIELQWAPHRGFLERHKWLWHVELFTASQWEFNFSFQILFWAFKYFCKV